MTFNLDFFEDSDPRQLRLPLPVGQYEQLWQQSQLFSTPGARWRAYLNQLAIISILPFLQQELSQPQAKLTFKSHFPLWEFITGFQVTLSSTQWVIIPSESLDRSELRIDQEWIDLPDLIGDYYLAVSVNLDENYLQIWGYTTHTQLKRQATFDPSDRTYSLAAEQLIPDWSLLEITLQLPLAEATRAEISPLPHLSLNQAQSLLERLGNPALMLPRLAVPFTQWGALFAHSGWRQSLYCKRTDQAEPNLVLEWLRSHLSAWAQQQGWEKIAYQPASVGARGLTLSPPRFMLARALTISDRPYELRILPQGDEANPVWRVELHSTKAGSRIPQHFKLRLLTEDLQPFDNNEDIAFTEVDLLFVEVALAPGEGLVWEIEPTPDQYEPEILRF